MCLEVRSNPENTRYWFFKSSQSPTFTFEGTHEWNIQHGFFHLSVPLRLQRRRKTKGGKWNCQVSEKMGGIIFNFISCNFNLMLPGLFEGIFMFAVSALTHVVMINRGLLFVCSYKWDLCVWLWACVCVCACLRLCMPIDVSYISAFFPTLTHLRTLSSLCHTLLVHNTTHNFTSYQMCVWWQVEAEVGTIVLLSVRVADHWCWGAREGRPVRSSGRPVAASGVAGVAVCPEALVEATEVSPRNFQGFSVEKL